MRKFFMVYIFYFKEKLSGLFFLDVKNIPFNVCDKLTPWTQALHDKCCANFKSAGKTGFIS